MEYLLLGFAIYFYLNYREKKKERKRAKIKDSDLDAQLTDLLTNSDDPTSMGAEIKRYLLAVLDDDKNDREKYSDEKLAWGQKIIDRTGANGLYFMTDIACQLALLTTATINGIPTQIDTASGKVITPEYIIHSVIKI
ncbi:MAG: hypothetical protein EXQ73_01105 [Candidatus Nanopelagicaceae bacterium]|nr:hypothetical protein [Candidatus Nanopelagicaceae bacterium]